MILGTQSILVVVAIFVAAPLISAAAGRAVRSLVVPIAVVELVGGAALGPHGFGAAHLGETLDVLGSLGLGFLFFYAGYEIDFERIRGAPLRLGTIGWLFSLALAYSFAGILAAAGVVISGVLTGSAMCTTAIGTILPVLRDTDQLKGRFGSAILAAGAVGELGPVVIVTVLLGGESDKVSQALVLAGFVVLMVLMAFVSSGAVGRSWGFLSRSLETSGQLLVRLTVALVVVLLVLANSLGFDVVLGGFAAGMIARFTLRGRDAAQYERKLDAIAFGFLIPLFFIKSGMNLDLSALGNDVGAVLKVPMFLALFLVVRGLPALTLYRRQLPLRDRVSLGLFSATQLPLVVAITTIGVDQQLMRPSTAVALVTAAALSVLLFPTLALLVRRSGFAPGASPPLPGVVPVTPSEAEGV